MCVENTGVDVVKTSRCDNVDPMLDPSLEACLQWDICEIASARLVLFYNIYWKFLDAGQYFQFKYHTLRCMQIAIS